MQRFAFIGGTIRGYKLLSFLLSKKKIPEFAIVLNEDKHESEKYADKLGSMLEKHNIEFSRKKKLTEEDYKRIKDSNLDFVAVYGWRTIIDSSINDFLKLGVLVAHHSLLPKYRGFAPVQWAMINGESETGVTLFQINDKAIDSGKIISQKKVKIELSDYAAELDDKLINATIEIYDELFKDLEKGKIRFSDQDESQATYTCKRIPEDGRIDWTQTSLQVYNLIRALSYPFPGAYCFYKDKPYVIWNATLGESDNKIFSGCVPGRILKISPDGVEVLCKKGTILVRQWEEMGSGRKVNPSEDIKSIAVTL